MAEHMGEIRTSTLKYLSVCSGIEAATVAWDPLGFRPVAFSEIEPFARAVLSHHYTRIPWKKKPAEDCPDGPRYRALGNSMAVNVKQWIGARIRAALQKTDVDRKASSREE
jgi:site-specific DNA-cytosine methylase